jgi:hypothetical protein
MMLRRNRTRLADPFRLSALGYCRAAAAWLRGPTLIRRWAVVLWAVLASSTAIGVAVLVVLVMQAASRELLASAAPAGSRAALSGLLRAGPPSARVVDQPGFDCHPMPGSGLKYLSPLSTGPSVVAIDWHGVVWGPSCVVTDGVAGP